MNDNDYLVNRLVSHHNRLQGWNYPRLRHKIKSVTCEYYTHLYNFSKLGFKKINRK